MPRLLAIALAAVAALGWQADASAVPEAVEQTEATSVSAHRDAVAWSAYNERTGRYRLAITDEDRTTMAPVAGRAVPFDVDLGPDRRGRTTAVYSRCRREPGYDVLDLPSYRLGLGCRLYAYRLGAAKERPLGSQVPGRGVRAGRSPRR